MAAKKAAQKKPISKAKTRREQLTKMRILIAKDVLTALATRSKKTFQVGGYHYLRHPDLRLESSDEDVELRDKLSVGGCAVCALGAMFFVEVTRNNDLKCKDAGLFGGYRLFIDPGVIRTRLEKYFSSDELHTIEAAFEGWDRWPMFAGWPGAVFGPGGRRTKKAVLRAIMENIVRNKGFFIPSEELTFRKKLPVEI